MPHKQASSTVGTLQVFLHAAGWELEKSNAAHTNDLMRQSPAQGYSWACCQRIWTECYTLGWFVHVWFGHNAGGARRGATPPPTLTTAFMDSWCPQLQARVCDAHCSCMQYTYRQEAETRHEGSTHCLRATRASCHCRAAARLSLRLHCTCYWVYRWHREHLQQYRRIHLFVYCVEREVCCHGIA